jgi:hypothetical protein
MWLMITLSFLAALYFCGLIAYNTSRMNQKTLYILRGIPGSGKTTLARQMATEKNIRLVEIDQFLEVDGVFVYDRNKISAGIDWCHEQVAHEMAAGRSVIVANTHRRWREMRDYVSVALELGFEVQIIQCLGDYGSVHDVPDAKMAEFRKTFIHNDQMPVLLGVTYQDHAPVAAQF